MKHSERVLVKLAAIMEEKELDMIEACVLFCEEVDIDPEDFIKSLDHHMIERLKVSAIQANKVRKCVATMGATLE
jgi:hypothetical protein